ncbi:MAG: RCC1 repeat- and reductase domain-containing protein [Planctomycetes bacterium]|nr:RCC1 repeat- and reductase domain-containing protein [Planctomycetota bacterium]
MLKKRFPVAVFSLSLLFIVFHLPVNLLSVTYGQVPSPRQNPTRPPLPGITVTPQPEATPIPVNPMLSAGGYHSLALDSTGSVWSWGKNTQGQLGRSDDNDKPGKVIVEDEEVVFASVAAGENHSLALSSSGEVWAWGENDDGQLGDNSTNESDTPLKIDSFYFEPTDENDTVIATAIAAGKNHSLALLPDGSVYAWGSNENGQLGQSFLTESLIPLKVEELSDTVIVAIAAGDDHSLALSEDGEVYAWGSNKKGQLGDESISDISHTPVSIEELEEIQSIAAGGTFNLALDNDGNVWAWGNNELGQAGNSSGGILNEPAQIVNLSTIDKIAAGESHSLAIKSETIYAWGNGKDGQLGIGLKLTTSIPQKLSKPREAMGIAGGKLHSLALDANGEVWAWGNNSYGQLGIQNEKTNLKPSKIKTDVDGNAFRLFDE